MKIRDYETKYGRNDAGFAGACYDSNSIEELAAIVIAVKNGADIEAVADSTDIMEWELSGPQEWFDAITAALTELESEII